MPSLPSRGVALRLAFEGAIALEEKQVQLPQEIIPQGPSERLWLVVGASEGIGYESAKALLDKNPKPTDSQIKEALAGNLCRCGTHVRILRAVKRASGQPA